MLAAFAFLLIATGVTAASFDMDAVVAPAEKRVAAEKKKLQVATAEFLSRSKAEPDFRTFVAAQNVAWLKRAEAFCESDNTTGNTASAEAYQYSRNLNCVANSLVSYVEDVRKQTAALAK